MSGHARGTSTPLDLLGPAAPATAAHGRRITALASTVAHRHHHEVPPGASSSREDDEAPLHSERLGEVVFETMGMRRMRRLNGAAMAMVTVAAVVQDAILSARCPRALTVLRRRGTAVAAGTTTTSHKAPVGELLV